MKKVQRNAVATVCLGLSVFTADAQSLALDWAGKFGGFGEDVVRELYVDPSGTCYTTGYFTDEANFAVSGSAVNLNSSGFYDVFVQKTDANGALQWARSFGSSESFEYGTGIIADASGNVYITGVFDQPTDFDPGAGTTVLSSNGAQDIFLVKLDASGNFVWAKNVGGSDYDESTALGVDATGNVYLSGYFNETADFDPGPGTFEFTGLGANDNFIAKYSTDGDLVWAKHYGSAEFEAALAMRVLANGTSYITGFYNGTVDFDPGTGVFEMSAVPMQNAGYLLQLDTDGEFIMAKTISGTGDVIGYDVEVDADENIYLAGSFKGTVDLDPGSGTATFTSSLDNGYMVKLDASGNFLWGKQLQSNESVIVYSMDVSSNGVVTSSGYMENTTDFNPDPTIQFELTPAPENAMGAFICMLDATDGEFIHAAGYGGCNFVDYHGAYSDADNNLYISGAFETTVDLDPDETTELMVDADDFRDNYLIKLKPLDAGIPNVQEEGTFTLYPNPASTSVTLQATNKSGIEVVDIVDQLGRIVLTGSLTNGETSFDISNLEPGIYSVRSEGNNLGKLIKK